MSKFRTNHSSEPPNAFMAIVVLLGASLLGTIIFAAQAASWKQFAAALGIMLMVAAAALLLGGLVGFLFGVPRTDSAANDSGQGSASNGRNSVYRPNTNLEQISDWLAKIIVGLGLVQLGEIPGLLVSMGESVASSLGNQMDGIAVFASALVVSFCICGFLSGWLWARLYLQVAFHVADQVSMETLTQSSDTLQKLEPELPASMRQRVREARRTIEQKIAVAESGDDVSLDRLRELGKEYERIRKTMPSGNERTAKMSALTTTIRALASRATLAPDELRDLFERGGEGDRIVVLAALQSLREPALLDVVRDAISNPRSAFEQSVALRTAIEILHEPGLDNQQKQDITKTLAETRQRGCKGFFDENTARDRCELRSYIEKAIAAPQATEQDSAG